MYREIRPGRSKRANGFVFGCIHAWLPGTGTRSRQLAEHYVVLQKRRTWKVYKGPPLSSFRPPCNSRPQTPNSDRRAKHSVLRDASCHHAAHQLAHHLVARVLGGRQGTGRQEAACGTGLVVPLLAQLHISAAHPGRQRPARHSHGDPNHRRDLLGAETER